MNLIEKWKNRKTKKKLREENKRLKSILTAHNWSRFINKKESEIKKFVCIKTVQLDGLIDPDYAIELTKAEIKANMIKEVIPFIEFSVSDGLMGSKEIRGTLYVVKRDEQ